MIQLPLRKIVILLVLLFSALVFIFFLVRRWRLKEKKKQLNKLKEEFKEGRSIDVGKTSEKDKELLEKVVEKIKKQAEENKEVTTVQLDENFELQLETPDIIVLKTPRGNLHKSFSDLRIDKIEEEKNGAKIFIES